MNLRHRLHSRPILSISFATLAFAALCGATALGGAVIADGKTGKDVATNCSPDTLDWMSLKSDFTFRSKFHNDQYGIGSSVENDVDLEHRIPVNLFDGWPHDPCGHWYLRLGADYTRFDFQNKGGLPLPSHLQSIAGVIALEYVVNDSAAIMIETRPGVYFEQRVREQSIDAPTTIYAPLYHREDANSSFTIIGGVYASALIKDSVLPVGGFIYRSGKWLVRAAVPEPRITYSVNDNWNAWVGGQLTGGGYSAEPRDFNGKSNLNRSVLTYTEYRAEAGVSFKAGKCTLDLGGGYAFQRKFDYYRAEEGYRTQSGAPFIKAEIRTAF